jgi:lipopolysaccharide export system protein LptC
MFAKSKPSAPRLARAGLLGIIFALLATLLFFIVGGPSRRVAQVSVPALPQRADAGLQGFSYVQSKDGLVDWKIQAKQAQVFEADAKAVLNDEVQVTLMGTNGVAMTVTGDDGTINTESKDFVISKRSGELALVFDSGYTIYTPQVTWDNQTHRIWTNAPVRITGPMLEATGRGMDAFLATHEMRIHRNVRVEIH